MAKRAVGVRDWYTRQMIDLASRVSSARMARSACSRCRVGLFLLTSDCRQLTTGSPRRDRLVRRDAQGPAVGSKPNRVPVLEFFEDLGYLTRRGLVDHGIVWTHFFWVIERYHIALTSLTPANFNCIERLRELEGNDPLLYQEFEYLFTKLKAHEIEEETDAMKRRGQCKASVSYKPPAVDRVRVFLQEEASR